MRDDDRTEPADPPNAIKLRTRKFRIEVIRGPATGTILELPGPEARIGSGADCDLVVKDGTVSRIHLVLRIHNDLLRVIDAGSRNGTLIDGTLIHDAYARPDSAITMGETTVRLQMLNEVVELPLSTRDAFGGLLGRSLAMRRLFALLERVGPTDTTLLIEGETGTGKELAAEAVHQSSSRASCPFVVFDCSAVMPASIESELFGQVCGAYPGAVSRPGCFEQANGGTLFLDEVGEIPMEVQRRLVRAIETRSIRRLGADGGSRPVDIRIIAAAHRSLSLDVERGLFRDDLYYRLAVVTARIPPLRERSDDIPLLIRHFERKHMSAAHHPEPLPESVVQSFVSRSWPGNVRELKNQVDCAHVLRGEGSATGGDAPVLGPTVDRVSLAVPLLVGREHVAAVYEKSYIEQALEQAGGNISRAAKLAGVGRRFLQKAMDRHGLRGRA